MRPKVLPLCITLFCIAAALTSCSAPSQYDAAEDFHEGLAVINVGEKYGFIDKTGNLSIGLNFTDARSFSEGMAAVKIDDKYGYIDKKGAVVIQPKFDRAYGFFEGMARVMFHDKEKFFKYGFIDKKGELVIDPIFYEASDFTEGLAYVLIRGKMPKNLVIMDGKDVASDSILSCVIEMTALAMKGCIDKKGAFVLVFEPVMFIANEDETKPFSEGLCAIQKGGCGFIDKTGRMIIQPQPQFFEAQNFSEGLAPVKVGGRVEEKDMGGSGNCFYKLPVRVGGTWSYIDRTGKLVIQSEASGREPPRLSEGLVAVKTGGKVGYCDPSGKMVIAPTFDWGGNFSEGLSAVKIGDKVGFIDKQGNMVIGRQFDDAKKFSEGLAAVKIGNKWKYIDKTGKFRW